MKEADCVNFLLLCKEHVLQKIIRVDFILFVPCIILTIIFTVQMQIIGLQMYMRFKISSAPNHVGGFKTYVQFVKLLCKWTIVGEWTDCL